MKRFLVEVLILLVATAPSAPASGAAGRLQGTITTPAGAPVTDATVTLRGPVTLTTSSDPHGAYDFDSVPPGIYAVIVAKDGFIQEAEIHRNRWLPIQGPCHLDLMPKL